MGSTGPVSLLRCYNTFKTIDEVRNADEDELNFVLLSLVAYLGHRNPVVSGVAFNEVSRTTNCEICTLTFDRS